MKQYLTDQNYNSSITKFTISPLKEPKNSSAEVNIQSHKNDKGENIVKFKTDDLQKVHAIVYNNKAVASK